MNLFKAILEDLLNRLNILQVIWLKLSHLEALFHFVFHLVQRELEELFNVIPISKNISLLACLLLVIAFDQSFDFFSLFLYQLNGAGIDQVQNILIRMYGLASSQSDNCLLNVVFSVELLKPGLELRVLVVRNEFLLSVILLCSHHHFYT